MMDRLDAMAVFVRVAETGSLSAAARAVGVSLASVSRNVATLEAALGVRLINRTTRRLALTDSGRLFYQRAIRILDEVGELEQALSDRAAIPSGRLHIAAPSLLGRMHVSPLLPDFLARYPEVAVDLTLADHALDMIESGVDLALRIGSLANSTVLARRLGNIHLVVCAAPGYLERRGEPRVPDELVDHDCLVFAPVPEGAEWHFQCGGATLALQVPARLRANTLEPLVAAAVGGSGLVRAPCWQVAEHIAERRLVRVLAAYERPPAPIHALFPPGRLVPAKVRAFVDFLVARWSPPPFECESMRGAVAAPLTS
jgi:DNA-binding transcriptional LysR family regulator